MTIMAGLKALKVWQGEYDFAIEGGGTGLPQTITLRTLDGAIPIGSVILGGYVDVATACLSATGTIALQAEAANDIVSAVGQASWTLGRKSIIPVFTGASTVKTTADRSPAMVIATAAFTAGKFSLVLFYR